MKPDSDNNNSPKQRSDDANSSSSSNRSSFLVFSLLVQFLHGEGHVGQTARDALLHCMALSRKNEDVGKYIAGHSDFCPVREIYCLHYSFVSQQSALKGNNHGP